MNIHVVWNLLNVTFSQNKNSIICTRTWCKRFLRAVLPIRIIISRSLSVTWCPNLATLEDGSLIEKTTKRFLRDEKTFVARRRYFCCGCLLTQKFGSFFEGWVVLILYDMTPPLTKMHCPLFFFKCKTPFVHYKNDA